MTEGLGPITGLLPAPVGTLTAVILLVVALALMFVGRKVVKFIVFVAVGLVGASLAAFLTGFVTSGLLVLLAALVGFII